MEDEDRTYIKGLFPAINHIQEPDLQEKVMATWFYTWKKSNFPKIEFVHQFEPARQKIVYTNVDHTNQVCKACESLSAMMVDQFSVELNMDELIAGAILHDVDKMLIFDFETGGFSATGKMFAHAVLGATLALLHGIPESVAHIIGAHSFRFSPTPPQSVEALMVRHLDHLVATSYYRAHGLDMDKVLSECLIKIEGR